jgi:tetratricopeptide (TPR) repeat protein
MLILLILLLPIFALINSVRSSNVKKLEISQKLNAKIDQLWEIAHAGMVERKYIRVEKALLTILKIDKKNAAAYNRLGILYAKQKEYKDATDCFEIATSIEPSASSLHNLGLIYLETDKLDKAATAFEQALKLEDSFAARHVAFAKVQERIGNKKLMLSSLIKATELEPNPETYTLLHKAYQHLEMHKEADEIEMKMRTLIMPSSKPRRILRPKRVV